MKTNIVKRTNGSKQRLPIKNRLQKYALGSQSLAVLSGVLGQTAICSAAVINLNLDGPNIGDTFVAGGGGSGGNFIRYYLDSSTSDLDDYLLFLGDQFFSNERLRVGAARGAFSFSSDEGGFPSSLHLYAVGQIVDGSLNTGGTTGYIYNKNNGGAQDVWTSDQTGAFGFKTGDNQFGFINVNWDVSAKTLTILGGKFESTASTPITVTAVGVPEPSKYAALLGLGALGLAAYRRRPGNKSRPKNN